MDWVKVLQFVALFIGLAVEQNRSSADILPNTYESRVNKSRSTVTKDTKYSSNVTEHPKSVHPINGKSGAIGQRYLMFDQFIKRNFQIKNINLKNGTKVKQRITKIVLTDIIHNIPDNEDYVRSQIFWKLYKFLGQLNDTSGDPFQMRDEMIHLLKESKNNTLLSGDLKNAIKLSLDDLDDMKMNQTLKQAFVNLRKRMPTYSKLCAVEVHKADEIVRQETELIANDIGIRPIISYSYENNLLKKDLGRVTKRLLFSTLHKELLQVNNGKINASIEKAVKMLDIREPLDLEKELIYIMIRIMSELGCTLDFATEKPTASNITVLELPHIPPESLRRMIERYTESGMTAKDNILNILIQSIEREERRKQLRSLYPPNIICNISTYDERPTMKTLVIDRYKKSSFVPGDFNVVQHSCSLDTKSTKVMFDRFENDVLDMLETEELPAILLERRNSIRNFLSKRLPQTDLMISQRQKISFNTLKSATIRTGLKVIPEDYCDKYNQCLNSTKKLINELLNVSLLQNFLEYTNDKLYEKKFASTRNIMSDAPFRNSLEMYKILDSELENYGESNVWTQLNIKRDAIHTLMNYWEYQREITKAKPRRLDKNATRLFFNVNPLPCGTIMYQQNSLDMGYLIKLEFFKLIDAKIFNYVHMENIDADLVRDGAMNSYPYINLGDKWPGTFKNHETKLFLEFLVFLPNKIQPRQSGCDCVPNTTQQKSYMNVQVELNTLNIVNFACFSVPIDRFNITLKGHVRANNYVTTRRCKELQWNVAALHWKLYNPNHFRDVDLTICS